MTLFFFTFFLNGVYVIKHILSPNEISSEIFFNVLLRPEASLNGMRGKKIIAKSMDKFCRVSCSETRFVI